MWIFPQSNLTQFAMLHQKMSFLRLCFRLLQSFDQTINLNNRRSRSPSPNPTCTKSAIPPATLTDQSESNAIHSDTLGEEPFLDDAQGVSDTTLVAEPITKPPTRRIPERLVRIWMAEIVLGVEALHELGIVCGDLSLDNVLLGEKGSLAEETDIWREYRSITWLVA